MPAIGLLRPGHVAFDWYAATIHDWSLEDVLEALRDAFPESVRGTASRGMNGYTRRDTISTVCVDHRGQPATRRICEVLSGGTNHGVHLIASGAQSVPVAAFLRSLSGPHRVTRVDPAVDFVSPGAFDALDAVMRPFSLRRRMKIRQDGDWTRGRARTLYLGSRKSPVFLRLYEKGHVDGGPPDWVRLEVEIKPKDRDAGELFSVLSPFEMLGASKWLIDLFAELGAATAESVAAGSARKAADDARVKFALCRQYGRIIRKWQNDKDTADAFVAELATWLKVMADMPDGRLPEVLQALRREGITTEEAPIAQGTQRDQDEEERVSSDDEDAGARRDTPPSVHRV